MVFLRFPFQCGVKCVSFDCDMVVSGMIHQHIASHLGSSDFSLVYNGKMLLQDESVPQDANVIVTFSLPGGKGGFGSMLRAIGAQIEKTTNREACRDLSGRRLRDINEEQRLKKWISKEGEREAEKMQRRKARIERLKSKPKHNFNDFDYEKKLSEWPDRVEEAVTAAMEKKKRPASESAASASASRKKKKNLWMEDDMSSSGSDLDNCNSCSQEFPNSNANDTTNAEKARSNAVPDDHDASLHAFGEASGSSHCSIEDQPTEVISTSSEEQTAIDTSGSDKDSDSEKALQSSSSAESASTRETLKGDSPPNIPPSANEAVKEVDTTPVDLLSFESASQLEALGLDRLKSALMERGLKCGGTLSDRAQRLFEVRGLQPHQYPPSLLAKKKK